VDVLERLEPQLGPLEGEPVVLGGGITNHNLRVRLGGSDYVVRIHGRQTELLGIDRDTEAIATETAARLGIGPQVVATLEGALVTRFIEGRTLEPPELRERIAEVAAALRAFHASGVVLGTTFDVPRIVREYAALARTHGVEPPAGYAGALERAQPPSGPEHDPVPCHNDLLAANFIHDGERLSIVDWEYAGMGDRYFDLGNFAVNNALAPDDEARLLAEYWGEPATPERIAALRSMRFMSDFREAMWGVLQSAVSDLDFDFSAYARTHFDRLSSAG
jgi:thiamine kinase-like enzyme